jgi:hypothetical protein
VAQIFTGIEINLFLQYFGLGNKDQIKFLGIIIWLVMPEKKRSKEEFETYLKAMLNQDYPKVKYNDPDAWRIGLRKT